MKKFLLTSSFLVSSFFFSQLTTDSSEILFYLSLSKNKKIRLLSGFLFRYVMFLINLHLRTLSSPKRLQLTIIY